MATRKVKFVDIYSQNKEKSDEYPTPSYALLPLLEYLPKDKVIWECTDTSGSISSFLNEKGYNVVSTDDNFLLYNRPKGDIIVTNPPYSLKTEFLQHSYELEIPFAFLLPITALEGFKRQELYRKYGISLILFNKRIQFRSNRAGAWFATAWFTHGLNLPDNLNFFELASDNLNFFKLASDNMINKEGEINKRNITLFEEDE